MLSINDWMSGKISKACSGVILDHDTNEIVDVRTARASTFLGHTHRLGNYQREKYKLVIPDIANNQAKADKSDPFIRDRVLTHLRGGLCTINDYQVEFDKVEIPLTDIEGNNVGVMHQEVPKNMKRP